MEDTDNEERNLYLDARMYGSLFEYGGLVSGISAGVSALQSGWNYQRAGLIVAGALAYVVGKIWQSATDRSNIVDELDRRDLEDKVSEK